MPNRPEVIENGADLFHEVFDEHLDRERDLPDVDRQAAWPQIEVVIAALRELGLSPRYIGRSYSTALSRVKGTMDTERVIARWEEHNEKTA